jgi:type IV secretory pathway VirB10-like protein
MEESLPREPNPENVPATPIPHGPLTLTSKGYLLLAGGGAILLLMAYGSCHQQQQPYGPRFAGHQSSQADRDRAEKSRHEYEALLAELKAKQAGAGRQERGLDGETGTPAAMPPKTAKQTQADDIEKRLHDAAYAVPLVVGASTAQAQKPMPATTPEANTTEKPNKSDSKDSGSIALPPGTILNAETVNMLDGSNTGPLVAMLTRDKYVPDSQRVAIPQGSKLFGEAASVSGFDQERLGIAFHSLWIPPNRTISLNKLPGLDQEGAAGLHDQVNHHYAQIFGVSMAIGALGGLAQIGNGSYGGLQGYDATTEIRNGITNSFATSAGMVLNRFLQRMPTIRIRPGQRIDILLMDELKIPNVLE